MTQYTTAHLLCQEKQHLFCFKGSWTASFKGKMRHLPEKDIMHKQARLTKHNH